MKISQMKVKFIPITITIETPREAEALWYVLGCDIDESLEDYLERATIELEEQWKIIDALSRMFHDYDDFCNADDDR